MRQSQLFSKTRKEAPSDEVSKNAQLLIRSGFINKEMAGVYSYLPLGLRVLNKIQTIIREEMNAIGGQEILLTALQDPEIWKKSGRWDDRVIDVWFKTVLAGGGEVGLGNTHEEQLTALMRGHIASHRDLPVFVYQMQTKFRNELRAKSGLLRTREFIMKDLYSFCRDSEEHEVFYEEAKRAYLRIFERVGIGACTYLTFASGGSFSQYSHEFQTVCDAGEDIIYIDKTRGIAVNREVYSPEVIADLGLHEEDLEEAKAIEVGNTFSLGTRFSEAFDLTYKDEEGTDRLVVMGSYGIGPGRLMGTVVEVLADERGLLWPEAIAPFSIHLTLLSGDSPQVRAHADALYEMLLENGVEVLYDDRDVRAGEKFADSDLIGIPYRVIVSEKTMAQGIFEVVSRQSGEAKMMGERELFDLVGV